jgi:hypothetical protein
MSTTPLSPKNQEIFMRKRVISLLLTAVLVIALLPQQALAGSLSNFSKNSTYPGFSDVPPSQWYADEVRLAYEYGLVNGKTAGTYEPDSNLTIAEAIKMAAVLHSIYTTGTSALQNSTPWYQAYVDYALRNGIISTPFYNYNANATRADFAVIFAGALPAEALTPINQIGVNTIPDVSVSYSYGPAVYLLYRAGILTGSGETRAFMPNDTIKRSEVAAIAARMVNADNRVTFSISTKDLTATEIAAICSPAVFYIEVFDSVGNPFASGSGFFISSSGVAVTNYHVIEGAASAKITMTDGKIYDIAGVYDYNESYDLAILQITGNGFPYLELGDPSTVVTGATVYAIGSPRGLDNTFSQGIVSNASRILSENNVKYIQFDAAISHGSSGGALINTKGQVIGVTSGGADDAQNLNFAVPINLAGELSRIKIVPLSSIIPPLTYTVTASESNITIPKGSHSQVKITDVSNVADSCEYVVENSLYATCSWSYWSDNSYTFLNIYGRYPGTTTITIYLYDNNHKPIAKTDINVTITQSSISIPLYPSYAVPDFGALVETPPYYEYYNDILKEMVYFYRPDDISTDFETALDNYLTLLYSAGFKLLDSFSNETHSLLYFESSRYKVTFTVGSDFKKNNAIVVSLGLK